MRLTARAILSAVRSCSSRPTSAEYVRRGNSTVTLVSGWSSSTCNTNFVCGPTQVTIRAFDHPQRGVVFEELPALLQPGGMLSVDHHMYRGQFVGMQPVSVAHCLDLGEVDGVDEDEDSVVCISSQDGLLCARHLQNGGLRAVLLVESHQGEHQDREDNDDQPGTLGELGHREDSHHDRRQDSRGQVDRHLPRQPGPRWVK